MAIGSGLGSQLGFGLETTYGTATTINKFLPMLNESLTQEIERIQSEGIIPNNTTWRSDQWAPGNKTVGGDVGVELYDHGLGVLFRAIMGNSVVTGTNPYIHTYAPGDLANDSLTFQVGRPQVNGTVQAFTYKGCQVASWEMACSEGEIATLGLTLAGREEDTTIALATPVIPTALKPMSYNHGTISIGGVAVANIKSANISGDNGMDIERRFFNAGGLIAQPIQTALRNYSSTLESEFIDMVSYDRFRNNTEAAFSLLFTLGVNTVEFKGNIRTDGATPTVGGKEILSQTVETLFMGPTNDASTFTIVATNQDASD
jgi:hypothetical protein